MSNQPGWPGGFDPSALGDVFGQLQRIFSSTADDGPVNWELARESALQVLAGQGQGPADAGRDVSPSAPRIGFGAPLPAAADRGSSASTVSPGDADAVVQAAHVADLWLDDATTFPAVAAAFQALTARQWVDKTLPTWRNLVTPVAARMADAMTSTVDPSGGLPPGLPPEAASMLAGAGPMLARLGGGLLGIQLGQAIGALASEVVGTHDVGYPLAGPTSALIPTAVAAAARDAGLPVDEVRIFCALRERAHARLFAATGWLAPTLLSGIEAYAAGIDVDPTRLQDLASQVDPSDPSALGELLSSGVLEPATSPAQQGALAKLELLLALVEGWVETVTADAARTHLPHAEALLEWQRRRRALGGPAERTFGALVGLELRPRRMREAAAWWARPEAGTERDRSWDHPDLLPDDFDVDDASAANSDTTSDDIDDELRRMLDGEADGPGPQPSA